MNIIIKNISFGYKNQNELNTNKKIFNDFSLETGEQNPLAILGPSGCGKTTLLRLIAGLLNPDKGVIERGGERVSFVFQEPRLLPWRSVLENVSIPIEKEFGKTKSRERARHFLSLASLDDKTNAYPGNLSGGQKQRVAIARAFAYPAPLLLMDEPFQSLDIPLKIQLMDLVKTLLKKENRLLLTVTHEPRDAIYLAGRFIVLSSDGNIVLDESNTTYSKEKIYGTPDTLEISILKALTTNNK